MTVSPAASPSLVDRSDWAAASLVLSGAFQGDPLWRFLYEDERQRCRALGLFFTAITRTAIDGRRAFAVGRPLNAVAVWSRPGSQGSLSAWSLSSWLPLMASSFPFKALKVRPVFAAFAEMRRHHAPGPHVHLETIGVRADARGRGLAGRLVTSMLDEAAAIGVAAYTETVTDDNVALYQHLGFTLVESRPVPQCGLTTHALLRPG